MEDEVLTATRITVNAHPLRSRPEVRNLFLCQMHTEAWGLGERARASPSGRYMAKV